MTDVTIPLDPAAAADIPFRDDDVFHLASRASWQNGDRPYRPTSLDTEGFVHLSTADQIEGTLSRHFAETDLATLVLVAVDLDRVEHPVLWEEPPVPRGGETYPHIYGPIDVDAVRFVVDVPTWLALRTQA